MLGKIDLAHPPRPQQADDPVASKCFPVLSGMTRMLRTVGVRVQGIALKRRAADGLSHRAPLDAKRADAVSN
jgi:hypothetical protein